MVARLRSLSDQRKTLTELDRRIQDSQQLAETYKSWGAVVDARQRGVLHLLLGSLARCSEFCLGAGAAGNRRASLAFAISEDRRRMHQQRFLASAGGSRWRRPSSCC